MNTHGLPTTRHPTPGLMDHTFKAVLRSIWTAVDHETHTRAHTYTHSNTHNPSRSHPQVTERRRALGVQPLFRQTATR